MRRLTLLPPLAILAGCQGGSDRYADAKSLIASHCAACHTVPGVPGADGKVGPSLAGVASRQIIAGKFINNRATLVRWIMHPQQMAPGTAMPEMGITRPQAMQIASYLSTLDKP